MRYTVSRLPRLFPAKPSGLFSEIYSLLEESKDATGDRRYDALDEALDLLDKAPPGEEYLFCLDYIPMIKFECNMQEAHWNQQMLVAERHSTKHYQESAEIWEHRYNQLKRNRWKFWRRFY